MRLLRSLLGLTQEELAQRLNVSLSAVQAWEQGVRRPRVRLVKEQIDRAYADAIRRLERAG